MQQRTPVCFRTGLSLAYHYPHTHHPFKIEIKAGVGERDPGRRVSYTGRLNAQSIRETLQFIRLMSMGHWAYVLFDGERVDDCDLPRTISALWKTH